MNYNIMELTETIGWQYIIKCYENTAVIIQQKKLGYDKNSRKSIFLDIFA